MDAIATKIKTLYIPKIMSDSGVLSGNRGGSHLFVVSMDNIQLVPKKKKKNLVIAYFTVNFVRKWRFREIIC